MLVPPKLGDKLSLCATSIAKCYRGLLDATLALWPGERYRRGNRILGTTANFHHLLSQTSKTAVSGQENTHDPTASVVLFLSLLCLQSFASTMIEAYLLP